MLVFDSGVQTSKPDSPEFALIISVEKQNPNEKQEEEKKKMDRNQIRISAIDPRSGFCKETRIFHSLRPKAPLPPEDRNLSVASYAFSILTADHHDRVPDHNAFVDSATSGSISFTDFHSQVVSLSSALKRHSFFSPSLSKGHVAFVLSPARIEVPVVYFALLSAGIVISPSNPASTPQEIAYQFNLTNPSVVFATSATVSLLPPDAKSVVLLDSPFFRSLLKFESGSDPISDVEIRQSDTAAILYSSGTTGRVKAVVLTHRNLISVLSILKARRDVEEDEVKRNKKLVALFPVPLFHVFGFSFVLRVVALGETTVLMGRFDFLGMLRAVEKYRVTYMPVSPPLVVAMVKSDLVAKFDLSSLESVGCGGAPLGREVTEKFAAKFPGVLIIQGYGLTESSAAATAGDRAMEDFVYGSAGRLLSNLEGKIVDPQTGKTLEPGQRGELWLRGPTIMKGYLGDKEATASTLDREGWLMTGDLCYFDNDGFLFIVDRLKELIKYKAYQVAPAELEHVLNSHPEISDAAVVPYPHEEAGQIPMAFVVRQPGSNLNGQQVIDIVAKQVAPYKKIRRVAFINAIPKSPAGKILRRDLVDLAKSNPVSKL